jgi:hypothetical protein
MPDPFGMFILFSLMASIVRYYKQTHVGKFKDPASHSVCMISNFMIKSL